MLNRDIYTDLQRQSLGSMLILIGASIWIGLLLSNLVSQRLATEWIGSAVITVGICAALYFLRNHFLRLACYAAVACLWTGNILLASYFPLPFMYLFGLVIVLSSSLIRFRATIILTVISTVLMMLLSREKDMVVGPMINMWGSLIAGVVVSRGLYRALEIINRHHDYTTKQMNLARDQRAQLVKLTKALQEASETLRHTNIQLRYAREAADEARLLKAQFAANVSHELRTPVNLVIGYSEVIVTAPEIYGVPLPPAYRSDIQAIYRNAKHLQDLINDILDISQVEASRLAITKEKTDIHQTLFEAATMIRDLVAAKNIQFNLELPSNLPDVWIDRTRIRQVVLNLLANAVRFTDEGTISLCARHENSDMIVSVKDTGIGISKEELGRVFEEFYQTENSASKKRMGTGLGLSLSMHVVQHHGGRLWAESEGIAGQGSTFSFTIPVSADAKQLIGKPALGTHSKQNPKCVVIFDVDVAVGQLFKRYLSKQEVMISKSQEELVRLCQVIQPSAIVVDRQRRDTDFESSLAELCPDTMIIFCPMPSGRQSIQSYGAADYLVKPVTRQALVNAILALEKPIQKILIIDDERDVTRMLSRMVAAYDQNCIVWQANNGADGLAMMYRERPDLVLLDIQMPVMDGFSLLQRMKHDPVLQKIPVIIASGQGVEEVLASNIEGEITLVRPSRFSSSELVNCVEAVVNVLTPSNSAKLPKS
jgi:signal transduction histidine kinase/DNA-binding response OmpR family regulator